MLVYLHKGGIAYRDLKLENILIDENGLLKMIDFGFAKKVERRTFTVCGTPEYMAPEVILSQGHDCGADWWSFGVLVYEFLAGYDPFRANSPM